jgi:hypothetical protein
MFPGAGLLDPPAASRILMAFRAIFVLLEALPGNEIPFSLTLTRVKKYYENRLLSIHYRGTHL